ncbi:MAG: AraC family transcriptional regulator [Fusicatenibacter sp.]|nr:AraC family transcriptional regulator [Fusicatenibacter sp.]
MEERLGAYGLLNQESLETSPLLLIDGGMESRWKENYCFDNSRRENYGGWLFQYTIRGSGFFECGKSVEKLGPGSGFLSGMPENSCYYLGKEAEEPWVFLFFHFQGELAEPFVRRLHQVCGNVFYASPSSEPVRLALWMHEKLNSGYHPKKYEGGEFIYRLLCSLLREVENPTSGTKHEFVKEAMKRIDEDCAGIDSVEGLAEQMGVSFAHFTRCFHEETGMSPIVYLTEERIRRAMTLLLGTNDTLGEIAEQVGFSSGNYFAKVFRKRTGVSPTEYRKVRKSAQ